MMEEIDRFQVPTAHSEMQPLNLRESWKEAGWARNLKVWMACSLSSAGAEQNSPSPEELGLPKPPLSMLGGEDPAAASISDGDCGAREEKQRELARKGSLKNGSMGSPVNQQPKKNNVMARTRLVVPNKGYSSLDQSPDEKPLVALDTDSDDDFDMSRYSSSGYSSAEINQDLNIQLLKDGYRLDEIPDDEDLDLIPPKSVNPTCMCCQATSSTACHIQ
ncbi:protein FAM219A isoform X4 [Equus quagga]|uniref:protein FAM219A isoform X4 n=1 Tax=Equus quagga TaxID=89248 RepID=UPI001EE1F062|nr:protein FAM219A isoform X4 [Equus quagga]